MTEELTVELTRDEAYLRRWMLRPAFLRKMCPKLPAETVEAAFRVVMISESKFFDVRANGRECGCIIFFPEKSSWDMHLCLATKFHQTREAIRMAISSLPARHVIARYDAAHRAVNRLLDDLGFSAGRIDGTQRTRELNLQPAT